MNGKIPIYSSLYFQGEAGGVANKKLKFSAKTLLSNFNAYIVKENGDDVQTKLLSHNNKSSKFSDDLGSWYLTGILKIANSTVSGNTHEYIIGNGDGERIGDVDEAAKISITYSNTVPTGTNITSNNIPGSISLTGSGIPAAFELNVNDEAGSNRYAQFKVDSLQSKVHVLLVDTDGHTRGDFNSNSASDVLYVDLNEFEDGFYLFAFVEASLNPPDNPDPGYPYTFNVGDPKYDGTVQHEDE